MNIEKFASLDRHTQANMVSDAIHMIEVLKEIERDEKSHWWIGNYTKVTYDGHSVAINDGKSINPIIICPKRRQTLIDLLASIETERARRVAANNEQPVTLLPFGSIDRERFRRMTKEDQIAIIEGLDRSIAKMKNNMCHVRVGEPYMVGLFTYATVDGSLNLNIKCGDDQVFISRDGITQLLAILRIVDSEFEKVSEAASQACWQQYL